MLINVSQVLIVVALLLVIVSAVGRLPLWPAVLVLILDRMLTIWPR